MTAPITEFVRERETFLCKGVLRVTDPLFPLASLPTPSESAKMERFAPRLSRVSHVLVVVFELSQDTSYEGVFGTHRPPRFMSRRQFRLPSPSPLLDLLP